MLNENQRLVGELEQNWDEKVDQSKKIIEEKVVELEALGVTAGKSAGLRPEFYLHQSNLPFLEKKTKLTFELILFLYSVPKKPHLVNLSPDPLLSECLLYVIGESETKVGRSPTAGIMLEGEGVLDEHAKFLGTKIQSCNSEAQLYVNGKSVPEGGIELKHGDRIIFGKTHVFRFSTGAGLNQEWFS